MERRPLGRTEHKSMIVALGGAVFIAKPPQREVQALIEYALDRGMNHTDVAPTYGDAGPWLGAENTHQMDPHSSAEAN